MFGLNRLFILIIFFLLTGLFQPSIAGEAKGKTVEGKVPVLLYHRFGPAVTDSMTVTTAVFESHLKYLRDNGYAIIPLSRLVQYYRKQGPPPPPKSVVITVDDGHKSVYADMLPLIKKYRFPVTLFIYPSAISNASYAMSWEQLREMKKTGLVDFQSHTYWHPNFKRDKRKMKPADYENFVEMQLGKSKERLEKKLEKKVDMLAWPFGIYNDDLERSAVKAGYIAAFTMVRRHTRITDDMMALPRYLMTDTTRGKTFEKLLMEE
jgi:peptidoglycan/xylan/chitin deacetylase (PgdA/CDA1 family)